MRLNVGNLRLPITTILLSFILLGTGPYLYADGGSSPPLEGTLYVESCVPDGKECIYAESVLFEYSETVKVDPSETGFFGYSSPWRFYSSGMRIGTIEEMAEMVRPKLRDDVKRIALTTSWSGVAFGPNSKSLAQRLSEALNGFPVSGMDGFVWIAKDGSVRTTHQAFTLMKAPYGIHPGEEVMVSATAGWPIQFEKEFIKKRDAEGIFRAGAGWDIFALDPDKALELFEAAAKLSHPIAAYNAALIRLDRDAEGDREAAIKLLTQAAKRGDEPAKSRLKELTGQGR